MLESNPLWYKDGVIYQVHIKSFKDSNNDGIGDINGVIEKLDYIKSIGINIIWLLPFYPSPLRDDGYDIADYMDVNPDYGTLDDFKKLLKEAHKRDIRVVTELVLNHTSDQHELFKTARRSPEGSTQRNHYVWSNTPEKYKEARIIFQDFEASNWTWDPVAKAYYWHRFYSHQPDLNFDNPAVHKMLFKVVDFWMEMGIDGVRLDAVPYLYEREGTNCENLPETHAFLKKLNAHVQSKYKDKMLLAEANQWPEDAVTYFGNGDECQMAFHFPLMPRIYMATQMENRFPIVDILEQTPDIPENCQWAMFLRNHDELTLEMVTDEERDFMYRSYVKDIKARINLGIRRRLAPLVDNNRRKIELLNILLFSFPGTPVIYYGDEIGMGDNFYLGDRDGVRTPMQWGPDRNAGFSDANPQKLILPIILDPEYHYESVNVEVQERNSSSLLWWMKKIISVRKNLKALGRGKMEFLNADNPKVLAFIRKFENEQILVVANLSRFSQSVELNLQNYIGYTPVEILSRNKFLQIVDKPYVLTLSGYDYFWFSLERQEEQLEIKSEDIPTLSYLSEIKKKEVKERVILSYHKRRPLYNYKEDKISGCEIADEYDLSINESYMIFYYIHYIDRPTELFFIPLSIGSKERNGNILAEYPFKMLAKVEGDESFIYNGFFDEKFRSFFLKTVLHKKVFKGSKGEITLDLDKKVKAELDSIDNLTSKVIKVKKDYNNINFCDVVVIKLYKRIDEGINPGKEILEYITSKKKYKNAPVYHGSLNLNLNQKQYTLAIFTKWVNNAGDAYSYFADGLLKYLESTSSRKEMIKDEEIVKSIFDSPQKVTSSPLFCNTMEKIYPDMAALLGKRTSEMHIAMVSSVDEKMFYPEQFSLLYQRSVYQAIRSGIKNAVRTLQKRLDRIPDDIMPEVMNFLEHEQHYFKFMSHMLEKKFDVRKIRIHGDFHLGHILFTGKDFVISNFEGPFINPMTERRLKRCSLRDVASILWSFYYSAYVNFYDYISRTSDDIKLVEAYAVQWWLCISNSFVQAYLNEISYLNILPDSVDDVEYLLNIYLLDKVVSELNYRLHYEPDQIKIPLRGINYLWKLLINGKETFEVKTIDPEQSGMID